MLPDLQKQSFRDEPPRWLPHQLDVSALGGWSSSRSALVKPSPREPSSSSACLTNFRITLADASKSRASSSIERPADASSTIRRRYSGYQPGQLLVSLALGVAAGARSRSRYVLEAAVSTTGVGEDRPGVLARFFDMTLDRISSGLALTSDYTLFDRVRPDVLGNGQSV